MRLVATEYLSLDGVFEEPGAWSNPWFSEQAGQFKWAELQAADALLLGRKTYEGFAAAWPSMEHSTGEFGAKMNSMRKFVVSSTLEDEHLAWNGSELLGTDAIDEVAVLKNRSGGDLLLAGSGQLFTALHEAGLIDVYRLMLFPVVLGEGARLFDTKGDQGNLSLLSTQTLDSGIVILEYGPAATE